MYFQAEQLSSVGSEAVESAVKQIDKRLQMLKPWLDLLLESSVITQLKGLSRDK